MKLAIDRFEDGFAVCQDLASKEMVRIEKSTLPPNAREGDILAADKDAFRLDQEATRARKEELRRRFSQLWRK